MTSWMNDIWAELTLHLLPAASNLVLAISTNERDTLADYSGWGYTKLIALAYMLSAYTDYVQDDGLWLMYLPCYSSGLEIWQITE